MLLESSTFPVKEISVHSAYPLGIYTQNVHVTHPVDQKPCNIHVLEVEIPLSPPNFGNYPFPLLSHPLSSLSPLLYQLPLLTPLF
jgi:hypothetical protein